MTLGIAFWILMLLWLVLGPPWPFMAGWPAWPGHIILFLLLLVLGWHAFGPPLRAG
jgi:hypothetical protein